MIVSSTKKFIFIANTKSASTSIEYALRPYADIYIDVTEYGKHSSISEVLNILDAFPSAYRDIDFFRFGVMREPTDHLVSLYNSHQDDCFDGSPLSTKGIDFMTFLTDWCALHWEQCRGQARMFTDDRGQILMNYIARYENLRQEVQLLAEYLDLDISLQPMNVSVGSFDRESIDAGSLEMAKALYRADYDFYNDKTGKFFFDNSSS